MNTSKTTRREFLKKSALAGSAFGAISSLTLRADSAAPPVEKKRQIKKGIMLESVPGQMAVAERFKLVAQAGFDGVEVPSGMNREEVLKARDASGLTIASVVDSVHWQKTLGDPNPAVRAAGLEALKISLQDCKAYGATSVLLVPAVVNDHIAYDHAYERSQAEIKKAAGLAEDLGVKIAVENVWNQFLLSPMEAARYIDELQSPAMRWHFDVGNVINIGWPEQWIRILGGRIYKLHIKEFSRKKRNEEGLWKGFEVEYLEGDNNWPAVMAALDETGYKGWGTAEPAYWPKGVDVPERLGQVSRKLDQIFSL